MNLLWASPPDLSTLPLIYVSVSDILIIT